MPAGVGGRSGEAYRRPAARPGKPLRTTNAVTAAPNVTDRTWRPGAVR